MTCASRSAVSGAARGSTRCRISSPTGYGMTCPHAELPAGWVPAVELAGPRMPERKHAHASTGQMGEPAPALCRRGGVDVDVVHVETLPGHRARSFPSSSGRAQPSVSVALVRGRLDPLAFPITIPPLLGRRSGFDPAMPDASDCRARASPPVTPRPHTGRHAEDLRTWTRDGGRMNVTTPHPRGDNQI